MSVANASTHATTVDGLAIIRSVRSEHRTAAAKIDAGLAQMGRFMSSMCEASLATDLRAERSQDAIHHVVAAIGSLETVRRHVIAAGTEAASVGRVRLREIGFGDVDPCEDLVEPGARTGLSVVA